VKNNNQERRGKGEDLAVVLKGESRRGITRAIDG
jgi:hypothetical protein